MPDVASSSPAELLRHFHHRLGAHFSELYEARTSLEPSSPVFALEHDLDPSDLGLLEGAARSAISDSHLSSYSASWLPFVVYAAEVGYGYEGDEYWTTFSSLTPHWTSQERSTIRDWFVRFHERYGGAHPTGAWATHFKIISWPITHAVLPIYLQRHLAQLLFEFSGALTSDLLNDPHALGVRLSRRATNYTERFRIFCENTTLVGQVAAALLSGENEPTPYLTASTLARIVEGVSEAQQARHWLKSAQASAHRARDAYSSGASDVTGTASKRPQQVPVPRLCLRQESPWNAYVELPDLTTLAAELPDLYGQFRTSRASVSGGVRQVPPSGLLYPGQNVKLARWPRTDQPLLRLEQGDDEANRILSDRCAISKGPWWVFRRQNTGIANEVKGKFVRPDHHYVLVGAGDLEPPLVPWCAKTVIGVEGINAYDLNVPLHLTEAEESEVAATGIVLVSHVSIRPVGVVASAWDGEGEVEWLAGEPAMIGIHSDLLPQRARILVDDLVYFLDWTPDGPELLFMLEALTVGTYELSVELLGDGDRQLAVGSLTITIRDPHVRPEGAAAGEGIRLLTAPARPTLAELWDDRTIITIDGPVDTEADLRITLLDGQGAALTELHRTVQLPLDEVAWRTTANSVRGDRRFRDAYDTAESCVLTVARDGIGFATLTSERGFQPLRWRFTRSRDGEVVATLVDRTDGGSTSLDFYDIEAPLTAVQIDPAEPFKVPPRGGLAIAKAGNAIAAAIVPTNPNSLIQRPPPHPVVMSQSNSVSEVLLLAQGHKRWLSADLRADPFAAYEQRIVGDAIARSIGTLIGGRHWSAVEHKLARAREHADHLGDMQDAVGISSEHKKLASTIAYSLYKWLKLEELLLGFHEVITPYLAGHGITDTPSAPRFLLMLAGRPGDITEWKKESTSYILRCVVTSPVLYRAARFAVLGTRALDDADGMERGFL